MLVLPVLYILMVIVLYNKCFSLNFVACHVFVFHPIAFSDSWDYVLGSHRVSARSCNSQLATRTINRLCLRPPDQLDPTESGRNATKR